MFYPLTVRDFLARAVHVYPDRVGVVDEPDQPAPGLGEVTYRDLDVLARAQAAKLDRLGVPTGGRVAFVSENSARLLTAFHGVSGFGRVLVPVNFRLAAKEVRYIVEHSGADVVYVDPAHEELLDGLDARHRFVLGDDDDLFLHDVEPRPWPGPDEGATATLNYTSGTTARPKGVQLTHRNNWINAATFALHFSVSDRDVYLHTLPQFHCNGWGMPFAMTGVGAQHVILRKIDGAEILRRVAQHGVTAMCAAPAVIASVLDAAQDWDGEVPGRGTVRIIGAGAPPPTRTIERVLDELGWEFVQIYGLTETSPLITINRQRAEWDGLDTRERAKRLGRAGVPALGVRVAVDDEGEVLTQSNTNLDGYWQQPEETDRVQADGWLHTGDGGVLDDDGYLVISDRKKDVVISGGENVSSIEVEDALMSHPAVREAAVIGVPDEKWGELVTALVVTDDSGVSDEELVAHCRTELAGYKVPKRIHAVDELPRTATGKLQKFKLREQFWSGQDRQVN